MTSKITLFRIEDFMRINKAFLLSCFLMAGTAGYSQLSKKSGSGATAATNVTLQAFNGKSKTSTLANHETPLTLMKGKVEDLTKRDAYSKHFKNGNGSFTAVIANGPIHYSKNGKFEDIDTKIAAGNNAQFPYANKSNLMESHFGATAANGILSNSAEGSIKEFVNNKMYWEVNGQATSLRNGADVAVVINDNKATYTNLFQGIDAEFTVLAGTRKLNYVLNNRASIGQVPGGADYLVFSEDIVLQPTWTQTATSRGIRIADGNGKTVYNYQNPTSQDAAGMAPYTDNTVASFSRNGNVLTVLTKVKTSWLLNSARTFPILVDPTSVYYPNNATDASGHAISDGNGASGDIFVGFNTPNFYRGWAVFNTTGLPACDISSATLSLQPGQIIGAINTTNMIMVGQSKYDFSSLIFFPSYESVYDAVTDNPTNTGGAYAQISSATVGTYLNVELGTFGRADIAAKAGGANSFFPVSLSASWANGTSNNIIGFYGYADAARRPYLTVVYTQSEPYCHPTNSMANCAGYGDCEYIGISNVQTGNINNTTTYNNTPTGYNAYPALQTEVQKGQSYTVNVTYKDGATVTNPGNIGLWIDWNQNGSISANEFIGNSGTMTNNQTYTFNFTVPLDAASGLARLRVRSAFTTERVLTVADFCRSLEFGETEDYNLTVMSPPENDDCEGATLLTVGENFAASAITGTTLNATNSPVSAPDCGDYAGNDVWYTITAPANGEVTIETGAATGSNVTDTGIAVYSGSACFSAVQIGCNDNNNTNNFSSVQLTGLEANEVLYIRVWSNGNAVNGEFQVSAWSTALSVNNANASVIGLYPNPAQTKLTIKTAENIQSVAVYSVLGQLVKTELSNKTVDVSDLSNGTYLLRVTLENGKVISEKFIKN